MLIKYFNSTDQYLSIVISYNSEVTVNASRGRLFQLLTDPVMLSAMLGHFAAVHRLDGNTFDTVLEVTYGERTISIPGTLTGPELHLSRVGYVGHSRDQRVKWELAFEVKDKSDIVSVVRAFVSVDVRSGLFGRFSGVAKALATLPEHMIEGHLKPYLLKYFATPLVVTGVEPIILFAEEGDLSTVFGKALGLAKDNELAVMMITAGRATGVVVFKNAKAEKVKIVRGLEETEVNDIDALLQMFTERRGKITVYTLDVNEVIEEVIDRTLSARISESERTARRI